MLIQLTRRGGGRFCEKIGSQINVQMTELKWSVHSNVQNL